MRGELFKMWMHGFMSRRTVEEALAYARFHALFDEQPEFWRIVVKWLEKQRGSNDKAAA